MHAISNIYFGLDNIDTSEDTVLVWDGDFNLVFDIGLDADGGSPKLKLKSICKVSILNNV